MEEETKMTPRLLVPSEVEGLERRRKMKTLMAECPEKLRETLREIICKSCDGVSAADTCDWRYQGNFCEVVDETVDAIHEAYWKAQLEELKRQ